MNHISQGISIFKPFLFLYDKKLAASVLLSFKENLKEASDMTCEVKELSDIQNQNSGVKCKMQLTRNSLPQEGLNIKSTEEKKKQSDQIHGGKKRKKTHTTHWHLLSTKNTASNSRNQHRQKYL